MVYPLKNSNQFNSKIKKLKDRWPKIINNLMKMKKTQARLTNRNQPLVTNIFQDFH